MSERTKFKIVFFVLLAITIAVMIQAIPTIDYIDYSNPNNINLPESLVLTRQPEWMRNENEAATAYHNDH